MSNIECDVCLKEFPEEKLVFLNKQGYLLILCEGCNKINNKVMEIYN